MNKKAIIPTTILILQFFCIFYLLYQHKFGRSHIPVAFIGLNIFAIISVFILISSWFFYFKATDKLLMWKVIIGIAVASIFAVTVSYILMALGKYE